MFWAWKYSLGKKLPQTYAYVCWFAIASMRSRDCGSRFLYVSGKLEIEDELEKIRTGKRNSTILAQGAW